MRKFNRNTIKRVAFGDISRRSARRYPDEEALVAYGDTFKEGGLENRLTFEELDEKSNQFANTILEDEYERMAMIMGNSLEYLIAHLGAAKAGIISVPLNPGLPPDDIRYQIEHSESEMAIVDDEFLPRYKSVLEELGTECVSVPIVGQDSDYEGFEEFIEGASTSPPLEEIKDRDVQQILYTSGTTARPKATMLSHLNVLFGCLNATLDCMYADIWSPGSVMTTIMPLFHCAQQCLTYGAMTIGIKNVVFRGFDPRTLLGAIEEEGVTSTFMLPTMHRAILDMDLSEYDVSSWSSSIYAMTPMDEETKRKLVKDLGLNLALGSGQTEAFPPTVIFHPEHQLEKEGNYWGTPCTFTEHAIMDDDGNILPQGEVGEIVLRGPNIMEGYYKDEEKTMETSEHGWHHMGDLGFFDEDGLLKFADRKKDMVKTGGENVPSIKVESTLMGHPAVEEAAVVGPQHERWGEAVTAIVTRKEDVTEDELIEHCKEKLAGFEVPKKIVFVEELPKTTTGKIKKHVLREEYEDLYQ